MAASLAVGCGAPTGTSPGDAARGAHAPSARAGSRRGALPPSGASSIRAGRTPIGEPRSVALEHVIEPAQSGTSVLFVSQFAGEPLAFVRRQDDKARGPIVRLVGEYVLGSFDGGDGTWTLVTSDGSRVCVQTFKNDGGEPTARGCAAFAPNAIVRVGGRLALIDAFVERPPEPPPSASPAPPPKKHKAKSTGKKGSHVRSKSAPSAPRKPSPKLAVDVRLRWVSLQGVFDPGSVSTGLRFTRPLEGMTLIDAGGRPGGVDLLWYAWKKPGAATKVKGLGTADIVAGSLRADGTFDPASQAFVAEGELQFGYVEGHVAPRLLTSDGASIYVGQETRSGPCEVAQVAPSFSRLHPARVICSIDPARLLSAPPPTQGEITALEGILRADPRRAFGQPAWDPGLVAWTGDRGFFLAGGALRSAARADGAITEAEPPFPARRSRLAWGAIAPSGDGIALVDGRLQLLSAAATVTPAGSVQGAAPAVPAPARVPEQAGVDRRRLARIGGSWWVAQRDVARLLPDPMVPDELRGRAHPDSSSLVGGKDAGLFVEVVSGRLRATRLDGAGALAAPVVSASPVRAGFDAAARMAGGAIVAGVSAASSPRVSAFVLDVDGKLGAVRETSLRLRPGDVAVRLTALPAGGALLTDVDRTSIVWLDDDGRELATAVWPADASRGVCIDGMPARLAVPSPTPGKLVTVPELAAPGTCIVGDPVWAPDGTLRWFGSAVRGLDSVAEVGVVKVPVAAAPAGVPPTVGAALSALALPAGDPPCPGEMVSIAGQFCVDRFEATLFDVPSGEPISPDFALATTLLELGLNDWATGRARTGDVHARAMPLPRLDPGQRTAKREPVAVARWGVRPNGYVSGLAAESACAAAGKRLCTPDEFLTACRGEDDTLFPYGDAWEDGACNVFRDDHPAALLHGNASIGHLDPRLDRVVVKGDPLLRTTGASPRCRSRWGDDAVYDMVGNLDEWVDDPHGAFAGGFFARSTRSGCDSLITAHPRHYMDYSTGVRCCKDAVGAAAGPK